MRWLLGALALNCVLLSAAGIVQKLTYDPTSLSPEIWGLWEAPEPRYFFASFTYKNHWCAYAALGFGILSGLTLYWLRRSPGDLLRGSPVPLALLGMGILAVSFPLSGSVLGILLILGLGIPFIGFFCHHLLSRSRHRGLASCVIAVLLPAVSFWVFLESNPEIKRESLQKVVNRWDAMQDGRMPWRYYHSKDSWAMFSDNPLWGWGLGSTAPLYPFYASGEILAESEKVLAYAHHNERFFGLRHSHNDWFQYLAETGIVGVTLLMLVPLFALGKMRFSSSVAQWSLLACGGFALFSFVDFPSRTPACLTLFVVTFACSLKYGSGSHSGTVDSKSSLPNRANVN